MACLITLPHEIIHNVFAQTDATDLAALSCTCRAFYGFVRKNRCLFKELYLQIFVRNSCSALRNWLTVNPQDNRPREAGANEPAWEELLPRLVKLQKILESSDSTIKVFVYSLIDGKVER
jgi:F-box-like